MPYGKIVNALRILANEVEMEMLKKEMGAEGEEEEKEPSEEGSEPEEGADGEKEKDSAGGRMGMFRKK